MERKQEKNKLLLLISKPWCVLFLMLPFIQPESVPYLFTSLDLILAVWRLVSAVIVLIAYIIIGRWSQTVIAVSLYEIIILFSTIMNSGDLRGAVINAATIIAFCMLIDLQLKVRTDKFLRIFILVFAVFVVTNLISILWYPNGMYRSEFYEQNWILGFKNVHTLYIIPLLGIFDIYASKKGWSFFVKALCIGLFAASVYIVWDGGSALVSITLWIVLWLVCELFHRPVFLTLYRVIAIHLVFFVGIIVFRLQNAFSFIIEVWLGKSTTFTGRIRTWDMALNSIMENPFLGLGQQSALMMREYYLHDPKVKTFTHGYSHCHNEFLQILFQTGLIGMVFFLFVFVILNRQLKRVQNNQMIFIICSTLLCFMFVFQMEAINMITFWGFVIVASHAKQIEADCYVKERKSKYRIVFRRRGTPSL